jgi:peptide chain release factor subunit 1
MLANDLSRERLRRLSDTHRPGDAKVLSLFLNLDPREFATPPARLTEIRSVLDRASRMERADRSLTHQQRLSLRADLERAEAELAGDGADLKGAHGLAVFAASAGGLFEILKLPEPVEHDPVIDDAPCIEPLSALGVPQRWCVLLANRRVARLLCGAGDALEEVELVEDRVHGRHDQGGWSQPRYQRSIDEEAADHLRHTAEVVFARLRDDLPAGLLLGAPEELAGALEHQLHPYLRERVAGRLDLDVEHTTPEEVRRAAAPRIEAAAREAQDRAVAELPEALAHGRAAVGLEAVLDVLHQQRVRAVLVDAGFAAPGVACPVCGWLGAGDWEACPADGTPTRRRDDVVAAGLERAMDQAADVHVLADRPELAAHGRVAALLRF